MICICGCFTGLLVTVSVYYVVKVATIHNNNKKLCKSMHGREHTQ